MDKSKLTKKTTETLSRNATDALASRVIMPTRSMSAMVMTGSSVKSRMQPLMTAQAGA